ncbi:MAG: dTDP-4-dehydrorhamnose reductase [Pseudomonadota bacterium]
MMILVFGHSGQVATELASYDGVMRLSRADADLTNPAACVAAIAKNAPQAVINAAAYTAVDKAEGDEDTAFAVNATAPIAIAEACKAQGIPFVHISTDYVFKGSGNNAWKPTDETGPLGVYGATKLAGEDGIRAIGSTSAILRTSWVFSAHGNNFVKTMLRLGAERDKLTIVADQIGGPTSAQSIAAACVTIAEQLKSSPEKAGTYHFAGTPNVSWADFARNIFAQAGIICDVTDIPTSAYPTPAKRPLNSRLNCATTTEAFGVVPCDWRSDLGDVIAALNTPKSELVQ